MQRRHFKNTLTFPDRLAKEATTDATRTTIPRSC